MENTYSKYLTVLLFGLLLAGVTYVSSVLSAYIFYPSAGENTVSWCGSEVAVTVVFGESVYLVLLAFVYVSVMTTLAFMIGSVFRSSALAIGVSLFLFFTGTIIVPFLASMRLRSTSFLHMN